MSENRGRGRPTTYKPEYCERVLEIGKVGGTILEFAAEIGTTRETIHDWAKRNEDFADAVMRAKQFAQAWWERRGRESTFEGQKGFNAQSFIFHMKNRFSEDYSDKTHTELTGKDGGPLEHKASLDVSGFSDAVLEELLSKLQAK